MPNATKIQNWKD